MCMREDGEAVELIREEQRRARKQHHCLECLRPIEKGELYRYSVYQFDGELGTHKLCRHCEAVKNWLMRECGGFVYHMMEEDLEEHVTEYRHKRGEWWQLCRLLVGMQRKWKRFDKTGLMLTPLERASARLGAALN